MSSIPQTVQMVIRGLKRSTPEKPDNVSQKHWDAVPTPPVSHDERRMIHTHHSHWRHSNRHTNPYTLERYVRAQREVMGVGYYPLREKWACKPSGMAVSLPHLKCMEEPVDETYGGTVKLRSEKATATD